MSYYGADTYPRSRRQSFASSYGVPPPGSAYGGRAMSYDPYHSDAYAPTPGAGYGQGPYNNSVAAHSQGYLPGAGYDGGYHEGGGRRMSFGPRRRSSNISFSGLSHIGDSFRRHGIVRFKRKGAFTSGITLGEAQANVRLSGWDSYTLRDLNVDGRGRIYMKVNWPGYAPLNYDIPVDGYDGYVDLQSLARRVGRAVAHYLQANRIPVPWDRIELQSMEEITTGTWFLKMTTV